MRGPAASLARAGGHGQHINNIRRDWFRQMGHMHGDHRVAWCLLSCFLSTCWVVVGHV